MESILEALGDTTQDGNWSEHRVTMPLSDSGLVTHDWHTGTEYWCKAFI